LVQKNRNKKRTPIHNNLKCMYKYTKYKCLNAWVNNLHRHTLLFMARSQTYFF
jgi:hypothetical protein